ncbi:MAG: PAS domain S-box protein [Rhodospirillales bacterium]|nr:PAS domain S-box protein [Rhodospirillales bacterium]
MDIDDCRGKLVDEAADAILISDANGIIRFWNPGAARTFGFTSQEAVGQSLDIIIPAGLRARHWHGYAETVRTGSTRYGAGDLLAVPALRRDGTRISVEFSIIPFRDATGRITGMGALMRDVTRRFEELKALRKACTESKA